jgi:hypothetical protein
MHENALKRPAMSTRKSSISVWVIRIGPTAGLNSIGAVALSASRALSSLPLRRHPFPRHDVARSFKFCEPKIEVEIVGPTHLSRAKKFQKKIPAKNVTDPSDGERSGQDRPNVFMAMEVWSYQAPGVPPVADR